MTTGLVFDEVAHRYTLDGRPVPGVTGALKVVSSAGYAGVDPAVLREKAILGTAVHKTTELDGRGELDVDTLDAVLVPYWQAWRNFLALSGIQLLAQELRVASRRYGYAGTLDILGFLNNRMALIDTKAVTTVMPSTGPQTAAYEEAAREWVPHLIEPHAPIDRYALQLRPDGTWQLVPFRAKRDLRTFLAALECHNFIRGE